MTDEQKRIACTTFFDELFKYLNELSETNGKARVDYTSGAGPVRNWYGLGDKWVVVESCNKDFSKYLVIEGDEKGITYYGKPACSFRISDHWNWFSNLNKCEDPFYIQCNSLDMPYPRYRPDSKPTKPRYGVQVCFTQDGETYTCVYGDRFNRKTKTWEWVEDDPKKVAIKVLEELEASEY